MAPKLLSPPGSADEPSGDPIGRAGGRGEVSFGRYLLREGVLAQEQLGQWAISGTITQYTLPFTVPLILLIIALSLTRAAKSRLGPA